MKKKNETFGETMLELEIVLDKFIDLHECQDVDILYGIYGHLKYHRPDAAAEYTDGSKPVFYFGPDLKKLETELAWKKLGEPTKKQRMKISK